MNNNLQIDPSNWEDIPQLDKDATNKEMLERINLLTDHMNYIIKAHMGIM